MPHSGGLKNLSGTVGATTLTAEQMPSHSHRTTSATTNAAGGNQRSEVAGQRQTGAAGGSQPHTHTLDGASGEANNLPPYYALSYIMRIA